MPVSSSTEHWIKPDALTINLNHFGDPDYLQVSVLAGAVVMAFKQDVIGYNAAHNYRTWPIEAANTYLETSSAYNVYARLTRSEVNARALIVYDTVLRDIEGREITYAEDGAEILGDASADYFFVFLGQVSSNIDSNGQIIQREWIVDPNFGNLDTNQQKNDTVGLFDLMFKPHYDNPLDPNEITWIEALTHLGVAGGVTMYTNGGKLNIPSIYDGLPIDGKTLIRDANGILKVNPEIELGGGGVSTFWDLSGIPSWITNSKPSYTTSEVTEGSNLYFTNERVVSALADTLKDYVTIEGTQEIKGEKNFVGGLKVNGSPIYYDTEKKYWKLEGDLLVTGGVTMYGSDSSFTPSTIMDAIAVDETTISKSGGVLKVIGETGGGLDIVSLQNYLTQNSYLNVTEGDNRYLKLSGGTISGTYGALTIHRTNEKSSLIKYSNTSGVLGYLGFNSSKEPLVYKGTNTTTSYRLWHEGNDGADSGLDADMLDGYHRSSFYSLYGGSSLSASDANNVDLNTLTSAHSYYQPSSANAVYVANKPSGVTAAFRVYVSNAIGTSSAYLRQRIQQYNSADIYERVSTNSGSTWTDWTLVQTKLSSFTASSTLNGTLSIKLGSISANVDNLYAKTTRFFANQWNYDSGTVFDLNEWDTGGIVRCYGSSENLLNRPDGFTYGNVLSLSNGTKALTGQLAWAVNHNSTTDTTKALWFRASDSANGFTYSPWRKIAFTDSNVASATKLETARTIWGQSFDGSEDVSGNMTGVGTINMSSTLTLTGTSSTTARIIMSRSSYNYFNYPTDGKLCFGTSNSSASTQLYIDGATGNVGIGTTSSSCKLHVTGDIFTSSKVNVNGIEISKSKEDVLYIDGNVVVRGGVTMYGSNTSSAPSILDSLPIASTTAKGIAQFSSSYFIVEDGLVKIKEDSVGLNETELQNYLTSNSYLTRTNADERYVRTNASSTIRANTASLLFIDNTASSNTSKYSGIRFKHSGVARSGIHGYQDNEYLYRSNAGFSNAYKIWDAGNDGADSGLDADLLDGKQPSDLNVGSATKLETARTIWGKSFDGTADIDGKMTFTTKTLSRSAINYSSDSLIFSDDKAETIIRGAAIKFQNATGTNAMILSGGNLGVGTTSPSSLLDVNGDASITGQLNLPTTGSGAFNKPQILLGGGMARIGVSSTGFMGIYSKTSIRLSQDSETAVSSTGLWVYTGGFVGINNSAPTHTLDVSGTLNATGAATMKSTLSVTGDTTLKSTLKGNYWYLNNSATNSYLRLNRKSSTSSYWYVQSGDGYMALGGPSASVSMKIDAEGNVIIPGNLLVKGGITMYDTSGSAPATELYTKRLVLTDTSSSGVFNDKGIMFGEKGVARISTNTSNALGLYAGGQIYLRPNSLTASSSVGMILNTAGNAALSGGMTIGEATVNSNVTNGTYKLHVTGSACLVGNAALSGGMTIGEATVNSNVTNGTYKLHVTGSAYLTGTLMQNSDTRYKTIHKDLELGLQTMAEAPCFEYHFNDDERKVVNVGTSAQYWQCVDGVTRTNEDGRFGMDYSSLGVVMAISLAKELSKYETKTDKAINKLKKRICELEEEIERLKCA